MVRRGRPQEGRAPRNRSTPSESFGGKGGARDGGNFGTGAMQMQMQMQMQPCFSIDGSEKTERRTAIFERTKMCKFFILGLCAKGPECRFAHDKCELNGCPDLFRTKLCKTLINTGSCDDPNCRYAHTKVELRDTPADEDEVEHRLPADANTPQRTQHAIGLAGALPKGPLPQGQSGFRNAPAPQISQGQGNPNGMQQANMTPANQAAMWQTMIQAASMQANQARQLQAMVMAQMQASGHLAGGTQPGQQQMPQMGSLFPGFMPGMVTWPGPVAEQGGAAASSASPAQTFASTPPTNPNFMQQQQQQKVQDSNLRGKNVFLDEVVEPSPTNRQAAVADPGVRTRLPQSNQTRLHTLGEEMPRGPAESSRTRIPQGSASSGMPRPASAGQLLHTISESEKRLQDTPLRIASEPTHICINTLRSVGSGAALSAMAEDSDGPPALRKVGSGLALAAMVPEVEPPHALRKVGSGLALAAMAAAAETSSLRSVGSGAELAAMGYPQDLYVTQLHEHDEHDDIPQVILQVADGMPSERLHLSDMLNERGITIGVKNTFLEFDGPREKGRLRAVQTAGGRLDLMG